jgi:hypothetical protein
VATSAKSTRQGGQQVVNFATTMADNFPQLKDGLAITQAAQAAEANKKHPPQNFQTCD